MSRAAVIRAASAAIPGRVAAHFYAQCARLPGDKPIVVALPGGESLKGVLRAIAESAPNHPTVVQRLRIFQLDEFRYSTARRETNWDVVQEYLLGTLHLGREQLFPFRFTDDRVSDLVRYGGALAAAGGSFDVVFLGVGGGKFDDQLEDTGHVGGIFPDMPHLWSVTGDFVAHDEAPKLPHHRMTATPALIRRSRFGIALILGERKRNALTAYLSDATTVQHCPAKLIDEVGKGTVFTDLPE